MQRSSLIAATLALSAWSASSFAHISYTGRTFGTIGAGSSVTIANQTVTSNFGWADASDMSLAFDAAFATTGHTVDSASYTAATFSDGVDNLYFGDSHKGKAYRFTLDTTMSIVITATSNATATAASVGGLTAGFSVYRGLAAISPFTPPQTSADHDFAPASQAWRASQAQTALGSTSFNHMATQGSWNALGDWAVGGDGELPGDTSQLSFFQYVGSAYTTVANGVASTVLTLGPGDYSIFLGGNDILGKSALDSTRAYGVSLNVSAVPEPHEALLMLLGLPLLARRLRARQA